MTVLLCDCVICAMATGPQMPPKLSPSFMAGVTDFDERKRWSFGTSSAGSAVARASKGTMEKPRRRSSGHSEFALCDLGDISKRASRLTVPEAHECQTQPETFSPALIKNETKTKTEGESESETKTRSRSKSGSSGQSRTRASVEDFEPTATAPVALEEPACRDPADDDLAAHIMDHVGRYADDRDPVDAEEGAAEIWATDPNVPVPEPDLEDRESRNVAPKRIDVRRWGSNEGVKREMGPRWRERRLCPQLPRLTARECCPKMLEEHFARVREILANHRAYAEADPVIKIRKACSWETSVSPTTPMIPPEKPVRRGPPPLMPFLHVREPRAPPCSFSHIQSRSRQTRPHTHTHTRPCASPRPAPRMPTYTATGKPPKVERQKDLPEDPEIGFLATASESRESSKWAGLAPKKSSESNKRSDRLYCAKWDGKTYVGIPSVHNVIAQKRAQMLELEPESELKPSRPPTRLERLMIREEPVYWTLRPMRNPGPPRVGEFGEWAPKEGCGGYHRLCEYHRERAAETGKLETRKNTAHCARCALQQSYKPQCNQSCQRWTRMKRRNEAMDGTLMHFLG